jgi:flagellar biosynthesis anti-sigma factor FlgM
MGNSSEVNKMRIDFNYTPEPERSSKSAGLSSSANAQSQKSTQPAPSFREDQAQLSGAHAQVQALAAHASQLPEIRQARVESLRQAVLGGQYHPEPEQVAQALVDHMIVGKAA